MTVHFTRQLVTRTYRVEVTCDSETEIDTLDYNLRQRGYQRKLLIKAAGDHTWSAAFVRVEVVADTERGDEVGL